MNGQGGLVDLFMAVIESQSNQSYIYMTTDQMCIAGGSEMLRQSTTTWVANALGLSGALQSLNERREWLEGQPMLGGDNVHVVVATSGRAVLLSQSKEQLRRVIRAVTTRALREAPGLTLTGAIVPAYRGGSLVPLTEIQREAVIRIGLNLSHVTPRHPASGQHPVVEQCRESGYPIETGMHDSTLVSGAYRAQKSLASASTSRFREMLASTSRKTDLDPTALPSTDVWRAVVHADGNGMAQFFLENGLNNWDNESPDNENINKWIRAYRSLSLGIESSTERSLVTAVSKVGVEHVRPVILGGDDVTVETSGHAAWAFALEYLKAFEQETAKFAKGGLTAACGVAYVPRGFPFQRAYELGQALMRNAKNARTETGHRVSAVDIHLNEDASTDSLDNIRQAFVALDGRRWWGGPYVLGRDVPGFSGTRTLERIVVSMDNPVARDHVRDLIQNGTSDRLLAETHQKFLASNAVNQLPSANDDKNVIVQSVKIRSVGPLIVAPLGRPNARLLLRDALSLNLVQTEESR